MLNENIQKQQEKQQKNQPKEQKVDPKIQEQFDLFIANGINIIHSEKVTQSILDRIVKNPEPIQAIAEILVDLIFRLDDSAQQKGIKLDHSVLLYGANILLGEIITVAETAGMSVLNDEQKKNIFEIATSLFLDQAVKSGRISNEELISLGQQVIQKEQVSGQGQGQRQMQPVQQAQSQPQEQSQAQLPLTNQGGM